MQQVSFPGTQLQQAIATRFAANPNTSGYTLYDALTVPASPTFPYIAMDVRTFFPELTNSTTGYDVRVEFQAVDLARRGVVSRTNVHAIENGITLALTTSKLSGLTDWTVWDQRRDETGSEFIQQDGESHVYLRGIVRFRFRLQYTPVVEIPTTGPKLVEGDDDALIEAGGGALIEAE